jgi:hypothetical protein
MEPPPPFHGKASAVDGSGGGDSNNVVGGLDNVDDIDGVSGGAPIRLTNMARPCIGQTPRVNCSGDDERDDERRSLLLLARTPEKRRGGMRCSEISQRAQWTAP